MGFSKWTVLIGRMGAFSAILGDFGRLSAPRIDFERFDPSQVGHFDTTDRPDAPRARMAGRVVRLTVSKQQVRSALVIEHLLHPRVSGNLHTPRCPVVGCVTPAATKAWPLVHFPAQRSTLHTFRGTGAKEPGASLYTRKRLSLLRDTLGGVTRLSGLSVSQ